MSLRRLSWIIGAVPCVTTMTMSCASPAQRAPESPAPAVQHDLIAETTKWREAAWQRDTVALRTIMAPEFVLHRVGGRRGVPLNDWMANLTRLTIASYEIHDLMITDWGDAAMTQSTHITRGWVSGSGQAQPERFEVRDLWIRRGGQWRLVMRISTPLVSQQ